MTMGPTSAELENARLSVVVKSMLDGVVDLISLFLLGDVYIVKTSRVSQALRYNALLHLT